MKKRIGLLAGLIIIVGLYIFMLGQNNTQAESEHTKITVTDSVGRSVTIPQQPQRVVVLNASNLDLFCAAGGAELVVGKPTSQALSAEVQAATKDVDEVGIIHSPNVEKILELKPDLVIGANVPYHRDLIPVMEQAGIPVIVQALDNYEQVLATLKFYGELAGQPKTAAARAETIKQEYAAAVELAKGRTAPRSLIIFGTPDSFNIGTPSSFVGDLVERLGGNNIAGQLTKDKAQFIPLSMEAVAKQNPEIIFLIMHGSPQAIEQKVQQDLLANEAWADIAAVKNKRVHVLPYQLFAVNPGVQIAEAMKIMAGYMYKNN